MHFRVVSLVLLSLLFSAAAQATEEGRPGWLGRSWRSTLRVFHLAPRDARGPSPAAAEKPKPVRVKDLTLELRLAPVPLDLSTTRQIKVTLLVLNRSRRSVHLEFPTTQRIEILMRDAQTNKIVTQWSEDQSFSNEPAFLTINPGERVEYNTTLSTRDLTAGRPYTVEAFFPNFDKLRIAQTIVPQK